jgi:hypothetical protein
MVDFRPDLLRGHVRAHDLLRKSGGSTRSTVRGDCAGNASAAP